MPNYPNTQLFIDGQWGPAAAGGVLPVLNPATGEQIGTLARAEKADLDLALAAADRENDSVPQRFAIADARGLDITTEEL